LKQFCIRLYVNYKKERYGLNIGRLIFFYIFLAIVLQASENYTNPKFYIRLQNSDIFKIAILPMQNASSAANIAYHFRKRIKKLLESKGYFIIKNSFVDKKLIELGIQNEMHLSLIDFKSLVNISSADAIMTGVIETATINNSVVHNGFAYTGSLKLLDRNGDILWHSLSKRVSKNRFAIDPINILLDTVSVHFEGEASQAIFAIADKLIETMPNGKIEVVEDNLFEQATIIGGDK